VIELTNRTFRKWMVAIAAMTLLLGIIRLLIGA
jgi:hypothetical protein